MRALKIVAIVIGALLVLVGLGLIAPGGFLLWAYGTQRDASGFFESKSQVISTSGYALATPDVNVNVDSEFGRRILTGGSAAIRIRAASTGSTPLFIGIGPADRVSEYLSNVAHDEVTDFGWMSASVRYRHIDGAAPASSPDQQTFWVARQEGMGSQVLEWNVRSGSWSAVIMNGDASAPVTANVSLGARFGILLPIGIGLTAGGIVVLAIGIVLIILGALGLRRPHRVAQPGPPYPVTGPPPQG